MAEGMNRKVTHKITGTRRGVSVKLTIEAPSTLDVEQLLDKTEAFIKNQIDVAVPKEQESMDIDGKAAAAGEAAE